MNYEGRKTGHNRRLAKVAVQCSADTFVVNQSLVLRINICCKNRHLRQAADRSSRFASLISMNGRRAKRGSAKRTIAEQELNKIFTILRLALRPLAVSIKTATKQTIKRLKRYG